MNASESKEEEEEEERQLLGHYFIYVFIILFKQREHVAKGGITNKWYVIRLKGRIDGYFY